MKTNPTTKKRLLAVLVAGMVVFSTTAGFAGLAAAATTTDLTVSIDDDDNTVAPGETTTVEIAVADAEGGVGSAELGVELSDPGIATITDVSTGSAPALTENQIAGDGQSADVKYFGVDTADTGAVTFVEITLQATSAGSTQIELTENDQTGFLVAFDEDGSGYSFDEVGSATLTVNTPPDADAGDDQTVAEGESVTLDASGSSDPDQSDTLSYSWTETSSSGVSLSGAETAAPTFTAPDVSSATTLVFEVEANDGTASDTDTVEVTVQPAEPTNTPPSADAGSDQTVTAGDTVTLDGSGSSDADGSVAGYAWTESSETGVTLSDASAAQPTFTAPDVSSATTLEFDLTVTDDDGATATDTVVVTVQPPEAANFQVSNLQAPGSATQGDTIDVSADVENTGGQTATKSVEFRVDTDADGSIADESAVASQDVELAAGASTTVSFEDVGTGGLPVGTLTHGVATDDDSATAQITVTEPEPSPDKGTTVSLVPADQQTAVGASTTYEVVVDSANGGVGAGEFAVSVDDTSVATISDAEVLNGAIVESVVTDSSIEVDYYGADTAETGSVVVATVTVAGVGDGTTGLTLEATSGNADVLLFDEEGTGYDVTGTNGASLEVLPVQFSVEETTAPEKVAVGDQVEVTATVSSDGTIESTQPVELLFDVDGDGDTESVGTQQVTIGANGQAQVSFDVPVPEDASFGDRAYSVETIADSADGTVEFTPPAVNEDQGLPGDPDGDGLYEDVNGDGDVDSGDAQSLFANRESTAVLDHLEAFDFNGDGTVNVGDAQTLFSQYSD